MNNNIAIRTIVPIILLMVLGFFSRKFGILKSGDERVLNAYVYYFALPALFLVDLAEIHFTMENLTFALAGIIPVILIIVISSSDFLKTLFIFSFRARHLAAMPFSAYHS